MKLRELRELVQEVLMLDDVDWALTFDGVGGSSLGAVMLAIRLGEATGTSVTTDDIYDSQSLNSLLQRLEGQGGQP